MSTAEAQVRRVVSLETERGLTPIRVALARGLAQGAHAAVELARERWAGDFEVEGAVTKAAIDPIGSGDGLAAAGIRALIGLLRDLELPSRLGLRQVPLVRNAAVQTAGSSASWVADGAPAGVSALQFSDASLDVRKVVAVSILTKALAELSSPAAETAVRDDLLAAAADTVSSTFASTDAASSAAPAGILNGLTPIASVDAVTDLRALLASFPRTATVAVILSASNALAVATAAAGGLSAVFGPGGPMLVVSDYAADNVIALDRQRVMLGDGGLVVDATEQAAVQLDSAPGAGAQTLVSLWQQNLIGLRATRFVNWSRADDDAVAYVSSVSY